MGLVFFDLGGTPIKFEPLFRPHPSAGSSKNVWDESPTL